MIVLLLVWTLDVARLWRDVNAHFAASRGVKEYSAKKFAASSSSFGKATSLAPTPEREFNLGTAAVAAGDRERGAAALDRAMKEPRLRADALYNRGTSALGAKAYDSAIRDYVDALKLRPNDPATKRNLEIAHTLKRESETGGGNRKGPSGPQPQSQKAQPRASGEKPQDQGQADADALLRAVQQQEKEELNRMHKARGEKLRIGW